MNSPSILVVEDNPITLKMVRVTLQGEGYTVLTAQDGRTAIELMTRHSPDVVLQDLMLPDMDGFELVKRLRAVPAGADVPILAFSGFLSKLDQARSLQLGFTDYLFKPVEPSRLLATVRNYLHPPPTEEEKPGKGRRIVAADDDPSQLKLLRLRLEQSGFQVATAHDGAEALEIARRSPPDAIVSDVLMPRLDGFRLCLAVRRDPRLSRVPVVLISAMYTEEADVRLARMAGASAFVVRTPKSEEIVEALLTALREEPPAPAGEVDLPAAEYMDRVVQQVERQAALSQTLTERLALREAELAVLARVAEVLRGTAGVESVLAEILPRCLDSAGVSAGAVYLLEPDGRPVLRAHFGFPGSLDHVVRNCFGRADLVGQVASAGEAFVVPSPKVSRPLAEDLLSSAHARTMLIAPILFEQRHLGALVLTSTRREMTEDWAGFARALGVQIGHAVALAEAFSRLEASEQRVRRFFETSLVGIYQTTPEGRFIMANPALARMLGYDSPEDLTAAVTDIGRQIYADPDRRAQYVRAMEEQGSLSRFESRVHRRDGSVIWISETTRAIRDESGRLLCYEGIVEDVSALKHAEEALRQTEKLAAMGSLLAGVAHELNNPLAVVMGQAALLRQTAGSGALAVRAEKIAAAAERCGRIVRNFLALARHKPSERQQVRLNDVVRDAAELLAYPLRVDNVEVALDLSPDVRSLWADPNQLHQVVVNLLTNAHQALREIPSQRRLTLTTRYDPTGDRVSLEVSDTGPGIPAGIRGRIFEPFFTTKPPGQGTGLGLSICQGIVESHGGAIGVVESPPGQGAVFRVELPAGTASVAAAEAGAAEVVPLVRGKVILVVDDEPEVAEVLADILTADGHQVDTTTNGSLALEKLERRAYDLILSDIKMPELDGPGLYRELERRHPGLIRQVVFLTGDELSAGTREFLERTRIPSLGKPFTVEDVRRVLLRVLRA